MLPMRTAAAAAPPDGVRRPLPVAVAWTALVAAALILTVGFSFSHSIPTAVEIEADSIGLDLYPANADGSRDLLPLCQERFITQELDHFRADGSTSEGSFAMRYFVCEPENFDAANGSIFFYVGNEADVTLYLNHTGLMWENAAAFNALIVFAEHRY
ncbi:hypothetical protein BBJ28_00025722, partial [Nothophytophthora sp. Chile5]